LLAEGVLELLQAGKPFTRENLAQAYEQRRRNSWLEKEARVAEKSRDGFQSGVVTGLIGMAVAAFSNGRFSLGGPPAKPTEHLKSLAEFYRGKFTQQEITAVEQDCAVHGASAHDPLMDLCGWPAIQFDGTLLVSHQDVLLMGGKVQAAGGYADHVIFRDIETCRGCGNRLCVEMCSGQAITRSLEGVPIFDREKCVFCGACMWNCPETVNGETNLQFRAGVGGLHSAEN
jgi:electron-transferring-flavoprotein dehydrogenase